MDDAKLDWIAAKSRCPTCGHEILERDSHALTCPSCNASYPTTGGVVDFLDPETRSTFGITDSEHISDHPFDGNAVTIIAKCRRAGGMVLDCGSGYKSRTFQHVVQLDIARFPSVDILGVNQRLPFVDDAFDAVFSLDVLEHVNDPFICAREICRVLRPGGYLYIDLPFLQSEHGFPNHYFNATRSGLQRLFAELESLSHHVPASGRAIVALHSMLDIYRNGLPSDTQGLFLSMTVEEILGRPPMDWVEHPIASTLMPEYQWALASTTQALMRKAPTGSSAAGVTVSPEELPGFPEFRPPAKPKRRSTVGPSIRLARRVRRWLAALSSPRPIP